MTTRKILKMEEMDVVNALSAVAGSSKAFGNADVKVGRGRVMLYDAPFFDIFDAKTGHGFRVMVKQKKFPENYIGA